MKDATQQNPYLEILATTKRKGRTTWTRVGTAFPTKNGDGYRLKMAFFPIDPEAELVILPPKEAPAGAEEGA